MALAAPEPQYVVGIIAVVAISSLVSVRAYRARDRPGAVAFAATMAGITVWCGAYALQLFATDQSTYLAFLRLEYFATPFVPVAWLVFVLEYTGRGRYVTRERVAALCVVPVAIVVLVWTNPVHELMWTDAAMATGGGIVQSATGVGFWANFAYGYALLAGSVWTLLGVVVGESHRHRRQALALVLAAVVPWAFQVLYVLDPAWVPSVNLTPFSFVLTGVIALAALERYELLESDPVAARVADERIVETLDDGVVIADATGVIVDANPSAQRFLGATRETLCEASVDDWVPALSDVAAIAEFGDETVAMDVDGEERYVELSASTVETRRGKHSGWVVQMHDVTERRDRQRRTEVLNRVLTETLQSEGDAGAESVAGGPASGGASGGRQGLRERAREALEVGDVAKEFEGLLSESVTTEPVDVVPTVQAEADRIRDVFPSIDVVVDAPLGEWAHCGGLFEPTCRALLRYAANCARAAGDGASVHVGVEVVDDRTVSVAVSLDAIAADARHALTDGVDTSTDLDPESPEELSCWLGYWGVERLGGTVSVDDDIITLRLPQVADPTA